jgi:hypothetical protein
VPLVIGKLPRQPRPEGQRWLNTRLPGIATSCRGFFRRTAGSQKLVEQVLNQVLEAQVGEQLQAEPYERTEKRQGYRNGYRERLGSKTSRRTTHGAARDLDHRAQVLRHDGLLGLASASGYRRRLTAPMPERTYLTFRT